MNVRLQLSIAFLALAALFAGSAISQGSGGGNSAITAYIQTLPLETVDGIERYALKHMREEEKLARDIYLTLHQQWQIPVFGNIANSEQAHMDLVLFVMQRNQIPDPVPSDQVGVYSNPAFTQLYQVAVGFGQASLRNAMLVGAAVEDLDIADLQLALTHTDNRDLDTVWQNLQKGSRNHLRAFYGHLQAQGYTYPGFYLSTAEILAIVNSPWEPGALDENGDLL